MKVVTHLVLPMGTCSLQYIIDVTDSTYKFKVFICPKKINQNHIHGVKRTLTFILCTHLDNEAPVSLFLLGKSLNPLFLELHEKGYILTKRKEKENTRNKIKL